ncbi:MAG: amino acid permease, partial [Candidatus Eremiobacteraeota bacterium]|nr:amino acid permease [Candidatus Eremiobacteraeota bacterium]
MKLARKLNAFDATLIVAGGIVGAGIFRNPSVVAQRVHTTPLILGVWIFGGVVAIIGGFIFAELAWRRPASGGLYGYMRDAFHPSVAFMYGWTALWVSQSGGMAAAAMTFAAYVVPLFGNSVAPWIPAAAVLIILSAINCFGVREGSTTQDLLMLLKIGIIAALIAGGLVAAPIAHHIARAPALPALAPMALLSLIGAALIPVLYAYDGWQTAPFMDAELKDTRRTLPVGLIAGVAIVIVLYLAVTVVSVRVLGAGGLSATDTPASDVMRAAFGPIGERVIAIGVALSTLGFISNQILT